MNRIERLQNYPYRIVLGSASPRRQQLLKELGFQFSVEVNQVDESGWPSQLQGQEIATYLAGHKSDSFARPLEKDELLITADTIVWHNGRIYNKPDGHAAAKSMLRELSGGMHEVFTGVCLRSQQKKQCFYAGSKVWFRELGDDEIEYYIARCRPFDKAGSYGIQDWLGYIGIDSIEGSFYNIMGLPVKELYENLIAF